MTAKRFFHTYFVFSSHRPLSERICVLVLALVASTLFACDCCRCILVFSMPDLFPCKSVSVPVHLEHHFNRLYIWSRFLQCKDEHGQSAVVQPYPPWHSANSWKYPSKKGPYYDITVELEFTTLTSQSQCW